MNPRPGRRPARRASAGFSQSMFEAVTVEAPASSVPSMPRFTFETTMGRRALDDIVTDMVLVAKLSSQRVPECLQAKTPEIGELIRQRIIDQGFEGRQGETLLVETGLEDSSSANQRRVLLVGIGRPEKFGAETVYKTFAILIKEAIALGVSKVTIPFIANRATENSLNLKGMAYQLKLVLNAEAANIAASNLQEIQIFCTPQARQFIQAGLDIPLNNDSDEEADELTS
ncbi:MAG: hypothetical protein K2W82_15660 [Candidatus Obscuribacterales bacterium]|nr:hypothetical protein [Candidatus Obscuribacterales bacterium]